MIVSINLHSRTFIFLAPVVVELCESEFFVAQSCGEVLIPVRRSIQSNGDITVAWRTLATENSTYANLHGEAILTSLQGVTMIKINLVTDAVQFEKSNFDIEIDVNNPDAILGRRRAAVTVRNDVKHSIVAMKEVAKDQLEFKQSSKRMFLHVARRETAAERITVPWHVSSNDHNSPWNAVRGVVVFEEGQYESVIEMAMPAEPNVSSPCEDVDLVLDQPDGRAELDLHLRACSFRVINDIGMGLIEFQRQSYQISSDEQFADITLIRTRGTSFASVVEWRAVAENSVIESYYKPSSGRVMFHQADQQAAIQIAVTNDPTGKPIAFQLTLNSVSGRDTLGPCVKAEIHVGSHLEVPGQVCHQSATLTCDQQVEVKWTKPDQGGPPSEYVVVYWKDGQDEKKVEQIFASDIFTCALELDPDCKYNVTVIARNSAGNRSPPIPVRLRTLPAIMLIYQSDYQFKSSEGSAEITITRNTTEFQTTLVWRMMRKVIHLPRDESSNYSSSDELEPLAQGTLQFKKGVPTIILPIKLRENMKTMRENNSLYLYDEAGEQLAYIAITVLNNTGVPGRVSKIACGDVTSREATIGWKHPSMGGPVNQYKVAVRDMRTGREKTKFCEQDETATTIDGLSPDSKYKVRVVAVNQHGKSRYSKFVEFQTLNELEVVDVRNYTISERVATVKITRRSTKDALNVKWQAVGLSDVSSITLF